MLECNLTNCIYITIGCILSIPIYRLIHWLFDPIITVYRDPAANSYQHYYIDNHSKQKIQFKSILDNTTNNNNNNNTDRVYLSLIIPAYNESARLPLMLDITMKYLTQRSAANPLFTYELIIVDDGSKDNTIQVAQSYSNQYNNSLIRVLPLTRNQGKGGAVQQGMLHSRGELLLMVDADGATDINDIETLETALSKLINTKLDSTPSLPAGIAIGSRSHLAATAVIQRKWYRNILMYGFHFLVSSIGSIRNINDTQCGFKLFTRSAAIELFSNLHLRRWCFDVELLYIAQSIYNIPIIEVPVNWQEIDGSKVNLIESSLMMGRDLILIRLAYMTGIWKINRINSNNNSNSNNNNNSNSNTDINNSNSSPTSPLRRSSRKAK